MITLGPGAGEAIKSFLAEKRSEGPLRIELQSSGCCDPTLGLGLDDVRESDLVQKTDGLTFVMSPETGQLAGEVTISYVDEAGRKGFVITSSNPVSEWGGFGVCDIRG
jgi:Fe-S cluster assembly iron-binding protein IscA